MGISFPVTSSLSNVRQADSQLRVGALVLTEGCNAGDAGGFGAPAG